jgi:hypothetical protein
MNQGYRFGKFAGSIASLIVAALCLGFSPVAKADVIAYMATDDEEFGTIDLNTGVFSSLVHWIKQKVQGVG